MAIVLASYGSALALEHVAHLHLDVVIEAVVLAATVSRVQRSAEFTDRLISFVALPALALGASEINRTMSSHPDLGDALFVVAMAAAIWVRRFGPSVAKASMLVAAPLVAVLILQGQNPVVSFEASPIWISLVAAICCWWVTALQLLSARSGFDRPPRRRGATGRSHRSSTTPAGRRLLDIPTRMALQMGVALAVAFFVGRSLWPEHWTWVVLTAFIVGSGARGRGDVVLKGALRAGGAAVGTVVATELAGAFGARAVGAVVLIFVALGLATWLREISYAYWAGCVTAAISLLYGWFGVSAEGLLRTRLEGIAVGAAIGIASSWLILPVRTQDVLRRRCGESLAALGDLIAADWHDMEELGQRELAFSQSARRLEEVARPHRAASRLPGRWWPDAAQGAEAIDAIHSCLGAVCALESAVRNGGDLVAGTVPARRKAVVANTAAVRRAIARRPGPTYRTVARPSEGKSEGENNGARSVADQIIGALADIDAALGVLAHVFPCVAEDGPPDERGTKGPEPRTEIRQRTRQTQRDGGSEADRRRLPQAPRSVLVVLAAS